MAVRQKKTPATQATGAFGLPLDFAPMEARAATDLPEGAAWWFEPKWDGFRCLVFKEGDAVDLRAKSGKPLGRYFPEVVALVAQLSVERFVIDGELVIEIDGQLDFEALQMRLHPAESRIKKLAAATPARIVLFDMLLAPDGASLVDAPLSKRHAALDKLVKKFKSPELSLSPGTRDRDEALRWLSQAGAGATDGVVAKQWSAPYAPGERAMVKVKRLRTADCVVGGFRYASKSKEVGSLLLGLYNDEGKLDHIGYTSTISDAERPALTKKLEKLRHAPGFTGDAPGGPSRWSTERSAQWEPLKPELVVEVRYDHVSGGRLRHGAKLMRWRPDKAPEQCTYEQIAPLRKA
ncbi:MAG: ligase [Hyphomicrobiales bacterium]|nr:ligase [Hyphomicrobiales bacterium]